MSYVFLLFSTVFYCPVCICLFVVCVCEVKKEALSEMKEHKRLIEKGRPDDVPPGFRFRTVGGMYGM